MISTSLPTGILAKHILLSSTYSGMYMQSHLLLLKGSLREKITKEWSEALQFGGSTEF